MKTFGVIMAGGGGTRFWPASRIKRPKQLLDLGGKGIMINLTADRLKLISPQAVYVVTSAEQKKSLIECTAKRIDTKNVIAEPCAKNTAACIGYAAVRIMREHGDGIMVVCPSDAYIKDEKAYAETLKTAIKAAESGSLVTIGIKPTFPSTGYGYIKCGEGDNVKNVEKFVEKPDLTTAEKYLKSGNYLWNSGVFIWKASVILNEIKKFLPETYEGLKEISSALLTENEENAVKAAYSKMPSVSIDYGVMEKALNVKVVPGNFGWSDVGSFDTLGCMIPPDKNGNVVHGDALNVDTENSVVYSEKRLIATLGVKDIIVVETEDAVLVCEKSRAQDIKLLVEKLKEKGRNDLI